MTELIGPIGSQRSFTANLDGGYVASSVKTDNSPMFTVSPAGNLRFNYSFGIFVGIDGYIDFE